MTHTFAQGTYSTGNDEVRNGNEEMEISGKLTKTLDSIFA